MTKVARTTIAKVLAEQSLGRIDAKAFSEQIASYLLSSGRTAEVEPLLRDVMQYRADKGIVEVVAVTAHSLTASNKKDIEVKVRALMPTAKTIIISEDLQPATLGGIRLEFPNQQFDLSVRSKLSHFKQLTSNRI